jgi:Fe-S cluster biogenesis protein NfuA
VLESQIEIHISSLTNGTTYQEITMELLDKIKAALDDMRPQLQADGGDLEFVSFEDNKVYVRLTGACGNCPMATMTLKQGVERYLKDKVSADLEVVQAF